MQKYQPEFKGAIEGYVVNFLTKEYWRVAHTQEMDDMLQEAWIVFDRCARAYPGVEARHFMALFKTAWSRKFTDFTNKDTAERERRGVIRTKDPEGSASEDRSSAMIGDLDSDGTLSSMLRQAPEEILLVLRMFLSAPQELLELALSRDRPGQVNRLLGLPPEYDPIASVHEYFGVPMQPVPEDAPYI